MAGTLSVVFLVASAISLIVLLHAITVMAKRMMGGSIKPVSRNGCVPTSKQGRVRDDESHR